MSLYLIELKIKTALELVSHIGKLNAYEGENLSMRSSIDRELMRLRGVLREIINRPKEEGNNG